MKRATRKKVYSPPDMQLVTYDTARAKIETEQNAKVPTDRWPRLALYALLLALPSLVLLSAIDPSDFLLHRVLGTVPLLVWNAWAVLSFWASLSAERLLKAFGRKNPLGPNTQSFFFLLGLVNCISIVALLWLVGRAG